MIKKIKRWWKHNMKTVLYVYVITIDGKVSLALYDKWEAYNHCKMLSERGIPNVEVIETQIL
jgi:predicted negative regulator of RcsB-dependent stress response